MTSEQFRRASTALAPHSTPSPCPSETTETSQSSRCGAVGPRSLLAIRNAANGATFARRALWRRRRALTFMEASFRRLLRRLPKDSTLFPLAVRFPVVVCYAVPDAAADAAAVAADAGHQPPRRGGGGSGVMGRKPSRGRSARSPARSTAACWTKPRTSAKGKGSITRRVPTLSSFCWHAFLGRRVLSTHRQTSRAMKTPPEQKTSVLVR